MEKIPILLHGAIAGLIVYQSAIVAPNVFRLMSPKDSSLFLRTIFPRFFLIIVVLSLLGNLFALIYLNWSSAIICGISASLSLVAYVLIPMTNRSRDEGNDAKFNRLHLASVIITTTILLLSILGALL
jgi:hypothetical protein